MYAPTIKAFFKNGPISDEDLKRLTILVPPKERHLRKKCEYEVLVFHTPADWDKCQDEAGMKRHIQAKFRDYEEAEHYAQCLLVQRYHPVHYHKVVLRV